tara:strand:+ start:225 stop:506 length:282 start_codon:yes stop_codon:yes gene_type:complete
MTDEPARKDLRAAADEARRRDEQLSDDPEPSLGRRFGQIGILGWMIVVPVLVGVVSGAWLDALLGSKIVLTAALTIAGAALGLWLAFRWMHDQ